VVEVGVGDDDESHGLRRETNVPEGGHDRVSRRRARPGVDDQRSFLAGDQVLEQVPGADQRLDAPHPGPDLDHAHR